MYHDILARTLGKCTACNMIDEFHETLRRDRSLGHDTHPDTSSLALVRPVVEHLGAELERWLVTFGYMQLKVFCRWRKSGRSVEKGTRVGSFTSDPRGSLTCFTELRLGIYIVHKVFERFWGHVTNGILPAATHQDHQDQCFHQNPVRGIHPGSWRSH